MYNDESMIKAHIEYRGEFLQSVYNDESMIKVHIAYRGESIQPVYNDERGDTVNCTICVQR